MNSRQVNSMCELYMSTSICTRHYQPCFKPIIWNLISLFEACSASVATRATDLIRIHESDNVRKGEYILSYILKVLKTFPFSSACLSPFSSWNTAIVTLSDGCTLRILEIPERNCHSRK